MAATDFNDDFNRANSATVGEGWAEIETGGTCAIASNTAELVRSGGVTSIQKTGSITAKTPTRIDHRVKVSTTSGEWGIYVRGGGNHVLLVSGLSGNLRYYTGSSWNNFNTYSSDTYVIISLRNINYGTDTYDIWVNGVEDTTGIAFQTNVSEIDEIIVEPIANMTMNLDYSVTSINATVTPTALALSTTAQEPIIVIKTSVLPLAAILTLHNPVVIAPKIWLLGKEISEGPGVIGTRFVSKRYPVEEGIEAATTKRSKDSPTLQPQFNLTREKFR